MDLFQSILHCLRLPRDIGEDDVLLVGQHRVSCCSPPSGLNSWIQSVLSTIHYGLGWRPF
ncbi:hypothetical protein EYF80_050219 [Liparis tanakae]|uniref:Uncharacterized protein n=1 Tax=Liparis tanakae TaxID=230148 RepID=A0A4Z2FFE5_9TELE|nr:hypothetical protein EYF80_050219 [Liparis tanakae]